MASHNQSKFPQTRVSLVMTAHTEDKAMFVSLKRKWKVDERNKGHIPSVILQKLKGQSGRTGRQGQHGRRVRVFVGILLSLPDLTVNILRTANYADIRRYSLLPYRASPLVSGPLCSSIDRGSSRQMLRGEVHGSEVLQNLRGRPAIRNGSFPSGCGEPPG